MWPFSKKTSLRESGIFEGLTDWHSHILPGVDDGIKTMEEAIAVLEEYERLGFKKVWLTPHIMEDYPNETKNLRNRFEELKQSWKGNLEIALASENMLDNMFEERLEKNDFLPIGDEGEQLLVETSYYTPPFAMEEMIDKARTKGYELILAHPERYRYMEEKDYLKWKDKGLLFQMNLFSLTGAYGETARKKSEWLLSNDLIDFFGTDIHKLNVIRGNIEIKIKGKKIADIKKVFQNFPNNSI